MAVYGTAAFEVRPETLADSVAAIEEFTAAVSANEPGTLLYVSMRDPGRPERFLHWMAFRDEAARGAHTETEWVKRFTDRLYPNCVAPVAFTTFEGVASSLDA